MLEHYYCLAQPQRIQSKLKSFPWALKNPIVTLTTVLSSNASAAKTEQLKQPLPVEKKQFVSSEG